LVHPERPPQAAAEGLGMNDVGDIRAVLEQVPDPEIPALSIVDLGIVRAVAPDRVTITPTYTGCPATQVIARDIRDALDAAGFRDVAVETTLSPPWTTDWISAEGRDKLRAYGIAPPIDGTAADGRLAARVNRRAGANLAVACPRCGSTHTSKVSQFGSTPCKASYRCDDCLEPFDYFKCI
jgi:ring-1,2-phenylacetyl-CoA epoxidase subunit PaaD